MHYQLKAQQLLTYSRIRMYRAFLERLAADPNVRTNGESYLFYFMMLCSRANFRTSRVVIDGIRYSVAPGEWLMPVKDLARLFRCKTDKSTLALLEELQEKKLITFTLLHRGRYVKYKILNWHQFNTAVEDTASCTKEDGFFFFPYSMVNDFMGKGKCSEMDIVLDLWINAIYCDSHIAGSAEGPVVYFRSKFRFLRAKMSRRQRKISWYPIPKIRLFLRAIIVKNLRPTSRLLCLKISGACQNPIL